MNVIETLAGVPQRLRLAWVVWGMVGLALLAASIKLRETTTVSTVAQDVQELHKNDAQILRELRELRARPVIQIGSIPLPAPDPSRRTGGLNAVKDTLGDHIDVVDDVFSATGEGSLADAVIRGDVFIESLTLGSTDSAGAKAGGAPRFEVEIVVRNLLDASLALKIPRGQVFENANRNDRLQNLVAAENAVLELRPGLSTKVQVPAFCLNKGFARPRGLDGYITPLRVKFDFRNQDDLWEQVAAATRE